MSTRAAFGIGTGTALAAVLFLNAGLTHYGERWAGFCVAIGVGFVVANLTGWVVLGGEQKR